MRRAVLQIADEALRAAPVEARALDSEANRELRSTLAGRAAAQILAACDHEPAGEKRHQLVLNMLTLMETAFAIVNASTRGQ